MNRRKSVFMITAGILIGTLAAGPAAHAAESFLQAYPSSHRFFLDGQQVQMEAYTINGNNYVKLADVGKVLDFNVYWDGETGTVRIENDAPYTGHTRSPPLIRRGRRWSLWSTRCAGRTAQRSWRWMIAS